MYTIELYKRTLFQGLKIVSAVANFSKKEVCDLLTASLKQDVHYQNVDKILHSEARPFTLICPDTRLRLRLIKDK